MVTRNFRFRKLFLVLHGIKLKNQSIDVKNNFQFWIKYQARYFTVYKW